MKAANHFPADYRKGRASFIEAAEAAGLGVTSRPHPAVTGADGKKLFLDTATIGPREAKKALLMISATHGVEGYFGSAAQTGLLREGLAARIPEGAKAVIVHALNPFGFSWNRRVNEDNADINRNFVDHSNPPANAAYDELADAIAPKDISPESVKRANAKLRAYRDAHGAFKLQEAISAGQYRHSDGLYFGGKRESWSAAMLRDVFREELAGVDRLIAIDFHTGLGEHGAAEMITEDLPGSAGYARAKKLWGDYVRSSEAGESLSAPLTGTIDAAIAAWMDGRELTFAALEVGTRSMRQVLAALRDDNWLHMHGHTSDQRAPAIKAAIRDGFYPDTDEWKESVWRHATKVVDAAIAALGE
jgi:Protein of unknown function (DUF2817)